MNHSILIAGATGLVGSSLVEIIKDDPFYSEIIVLTRREITSLLKYQHIKQYVVNFNNPGEYKFLVKAESVVCALGTTIKKAGSKEKFREVDYTYPLNLAEAASVNNCSRYILVSAVGANPASKIFYNRVKGELERDLKRFSFGSIHILHPSLLLGKRDEKRTGEEISQKLLPVFSFLLPYKVRPVRASVVAEKIVYVSKTDIKGVHIYEGKDFYRKS